MRYVIVETHEDSVRGSSVRVFDAGTDPHLAEMARRAKHLENVLDRPSYLRTPKTYVCRVEEA